MKRTPFNRKPSASTAKPARARPVHTRLAVNVNMPRVTGEVVTLAKESPVRSEQYRRHAVMVLCDCDESRKEIDSDARKAQLFHERVRGPYSKHFAARGAV